jgi:hypothetical protein
VDGCERHMVVEMPCESQTTACSDQGSESLDCLIHHVFLPPKMSRSGIIVSRVGAELRFGSLELLAPDNVVMGCEGWRRRRKHPGANSPVMCYTALTWSSLSGGVRSSQGVLKRRY